MVSYWWYRAIGPLALSVLIVATSAFSPRATNCHEWNSCSNRLLSGESRVFLSETKLHVSLNDKEESSSTTHLVFPGGGIFFYWQAGAVTYLRERGYDLSGVTLSGASAGALTATLTATGVDFEKATELALDLAQDAGVWDRKGGLQGIWGPMIEQWLDELLPNDAVETVNGRLSLLVTPVPSFGKTKVSRFRDRRDLICCNMASVHLPWFLDGTLTTDYRGASHIDGSFLAKAKDYLPEEQHKTVIQFDWTKDPIMAESAYDFVKVVSKAGIWNIVETGKAFAEKMEARGDFEALQLRGGGVSTQRIKR